MTKAIVSLVLLMSVPSLALAQATPEMKTDHGRMYGR